MPLRAFNEQGRHVKAHGLVVQDRAGESRKVFNLEVDLCISEPRMPGIFTQAQEI